MRRAGPTLLACSLLVAGCAYHNVIHNAQGLFDVGEEHRRAGRDSLARVQYREVVRKTGEAYRARPESDWACDALLLLGRSHMRLGDLRAARAAFERVETAPRACERAGDVHVWLASVAADLGNRESALERVNAVLQGGSLSRETAAEAHALRGRLLLERSLVDHAIWDLDRATELDAGIRMSAGLATLRWSVEEGDRERGRRALRRLYSYPEAGVRADSVVDLSVAAAKRWGPSDAAALLAGVEDAEWDRPARARVALQRARHLHAAGDTAAARRQAMEVAAGLGSSAADARLLVAGWRLERARDLRQVDAVRTLLLPSGADPRVAEMLAAIAELRAYADAGLDVPLGWFAAAEVARDRLGAPYVARGLFLAYADAADDDPWAAKALLAAIALTEAPGDNAWLRGRLEAHRDSPYVLAALGGSAAGFDALEEELDVRLQELSRQ